MTDSTISNTRCYQYAEDALSGRITACKKVQLACSRFLGDLKRSEDPSYPWMFDIDKAERPITFMERFLIPTKGAYNSMRLMGWQCFVESNLYGWVSKETGLRRFTEGLVVVGRGNGKSTMMSGNASFGVSKDEERGADVYLLANSKDQASIVFNECALQIRQSEALGQRFRVLRDVIYYDKTNSKIMHRASDSRKLDGLNPHMGIFDEIHEYRTFKLINVIRRGMNKRKQPLALYITTMGTVLDGPLMHYYNLFPKAMIPEEEGGLRLEVADRMFCFICELDDEKEIEQPEMWIKANPSMGQLLHLDTLINDWDRCKHVPEERVDFLTKQLNFFANASEAAFVDYDVIKRNYGEYPIGDLIGRECYGGFDLSTTEDFTAAALEFPLEGGLKYVLQHSWVPKAKVDKDNEKIPYYEWAMKGYLTIVPGEYVQQDVVYEWFKEQVSKYKIRSIGYDPANAVKLVRMMTEHGFPMQVVRQGPLTLNSPMKNIKEELLDGHIITNKDPMFLWYLENVKLRRDFFDREKENWMPSKRDRYRKIDGFMAFLNAHSEYLRLNPLDVKKRPPRIRMYDLTG